MALLTLPTTPQKGVTQEYSLNLTELLPLISDTYFQNQTNWAKVVVVYISAVSNQIEVIPFIPNGTSLQLSQQVYFFNTARDVFNIHSISIIDHQDGKHIIRASQIADVEDYEINFAAPNNNLTPTSFNFNELTNSSYISFPTQGSVLRLLPEQNQPQKGIFWSDQIVNGDFTFTTSIKVPTDTTIQMLIGLNDGIPSTSTFGIREAAGWGVIVNENYINIWNAAGASNFPIIKGNTYTLVIKRVSGVVTYKVNDTELTSSNPLITNEPLFIGGTLQIGSFELSNSSIVTNPYTSPIIAGAYGFGSTLQNVQILYQTYQLEGQGQSFILNSPASVKSVKLRLSRQTTATDVSGTIKVILKASDFNENGQEISSVPVSISSLPTSSEGSDTVEFTFDTPVLIPAGVNSIKIKVEDFLPNGGNYIAIGGYSPSVVPGSYYNDGQVTSHVDLWFQVLK